MESIEVFSPVKVDVTVLLTLCKHECDLCSLSAAITQQGLQL